MLKFYNIPAVDLCVFAGVLASAFRLSALNSAMPKLLVLCNLSSRAAKTNKRFAGVLGKLPKCFVRGRTAPNIVLQRLADLSSEPGSLPVPSLFSIYLTVSTSLQFGNCNILYFFLIASVFVCGPESFSAAVWDSVAHAKAAGQVLDIHVEGFAL